MENEQDTFEGVLIAGGWEGDQRVSENSLYTDNGEEFFLKHGYNYDQIKPFLNKWVRIRGNAETRNVKDKYIYVENISCDDRAIGTYDFKHCS